MNMDNEMRINNKA